MNKNQLKKAITNLQTYVDDKIDKLPVSYEEKLLVTVPKESIDKTKADAATEDNPYTIDIPKDNGFDYTEGMFNNADLIIEYNGKKYVCRPFIDGDDNMICRVSLENNNFGFFILRNESFKIQLAIAKLDTTNITDIKLSMRKDDITINDLIIDNSISIGRTGGIGINSSAIGHQIVASGRFSHAEGTYTSASGDESHAEGRRTTASGIDSHAEGYTTTASKGSSHAEGSNSTASGYASHAEGNNTRASSDYSHAEGDSTTASAQASHAEGNNTRASGYASHAEGNNTTASGSYSHAEGRGTTASGQMSHAEGFMTEASSDYQHVQGKYNIEDTANKYAHIVGNGKYDDQRSNAHTLDWNGNAWFAGDVQGSNLPYTISSKVLATVSASNVTLESRITVNNVSFNKDRRYYIEFLGSKKLCSLLISEEMGNCIICSIDNYVIQANNDSTDIVIFINKLLQSEEDEITDDDDQIATYDLNPEDKIIPNATDLVIYEEEIKYLNSKYLETDLVLQNSISVGRVGNIGAGSSAVGYTVEASGTTSHAEGFSTIASGEDSHAEGFATTASGENSHAEGNSTTASGGYSHAEGKNTIASGDTSHAEGGVCTASGRCSHAEGYGTKASSNNQHVQGKFNIEDSTNKYAHIVGNGTSSSAKSNAHTLDWNGNGWYAGKLSQEGTPTEGKDLVTKKYVDDKFENINLGPYSIQYNAENNRLEFIYTPPATE